MKNVSSWQFSAPLAKVDLPRIVTEAADHLDTMGAVKVVVEVSKTDAVCIVLADSDLVAFANERGLDTLPVAVLAKETGLRRAPGGLLCGPSIPTISPEALGAILDGGALFMFRVKNEQAADALIAKLVDRVVVRVEAF